MDNGYLQFYGENNISPVRQDISDYELHIRRRSKLYRQLGIPEITFRDKELLEVGPGGGYNSLVFFSWGCRHIDLVEANRKGISDIKDNFNSQNIDYSKYSIIESTIEEYDTDKTYDIVVAEGFIQHISNRSEVIDKLISLTKMGRLSEN